MEMPRSIDMHQAGKRMSDGTSLPQISELFKISIIKLLPKKRTVHRLMSGCVWVFEHGVARHMSCKQLRT